MALQKSMTLVKDHAVEHFQDAYIFVLDVRVQQRRDDDRKFWFLIAEIGIFDSKESKDSDQQPVATDSFRAEFPADESINPIAWLYGELAKLPQYEGAVDV